MNKKIFQSVTTQPKAATSTNEAGGAAYSVNDKHALAQLMATATFTDKFYKTGHAELTQLISKLESVYRAEGPEFIAKAIVYAREDAYMKDTPAVALVWLSTKTDAESRALFRSIFPRVVDNGKMLRNVVQVVRSGVTGRRNFGHLIRNQIQAWFDAKSSDYIFRASVGTPSLGEIIRMLHVKPAGKAKAALYSYLTNANPRNGVTSEDLPGIVKHFKDFLEGKTTEAPKVPFQMLTGTKIPTETWEQIARNGGYQFTRMNLNTMERQGVFKNEDLVTTIANKLTNREEIHKSRQFPHQMWMSATMARENATLPRKVKNAMEEALDISVENVPEFDGEVWAFPDLSGSMNAAVTGWRGSATSRVTCFDVACLLSAVVKKRSPNGHVLPFADSVFPNGDKVSERDSVLTMAEHIRNSGGGGTALSAPLKYLLTNKIKGRVLIWLSDMQSWADRQPDYYYNRGTNTMELWQKYRRQNPGARAIFINLASGTTTQAYDKANEILNIGGWSDKIWDIIADFSKGGDPTTPKDWVSLISSKVLNTPAPAVAVTEEESED